MRLPRWLRGIPLSEWVIGAIGAAAAVMGILYGSDSNHHDPWAFVDRSPPDSGSATFTLYFWIAVVVACSLYVLVQRLRSRKP